MSFWKAKGQIDHARLKASVVTHSAEKTACNTYGAVVVRSGALATTTGWPISP